MSQVLHGFENINEGLFIDGTIGKGGHAFELLSIKYISSKANSY